jgi:hypothetical protein
MAGCLCRAAVACTAVSLLLVSLVPGFSELWLDASKSNTHVGSAGDREPCANTGRPPTTCTCTTAAAPAAAAPDVRGCHASAIGNGANATSKPASLNGSANAYATAVRRRLSARDRFQRTRAEVDVVLARCREPLNWTRQWWNDVRYRVLIWNKCNASIDDELLYGTHNVRVVNTPNLGREDWAYQDFMIRRSEFAPVAPFIAFLQGGTGDHENYMIIQHVEDIRRRRAAGEAIGFAALSAHVRRAWAYEHWGIHAGNATLSSIGAPMSYALARWGDPAFGYLIDGRHVHKRYWLLGWRGCFGISLQRLQNMPLKALLYLRNMSATSVANSEWYWGVWFRCWIDADYPEKPRSCSLALRAAETWPVTRCTREGVNGTIRFHHEEFCKEHPTHAGCTPSGYRVEREVHWNTFGQRVGENVYSESDGEVTCFDIGHPTKRSGK